jgi:hypothetical protein
MSTINLIGFAMIVSVCFILVAPRVERARLKRSKIR